MSARDAGSGVEVVVVILSPLNVPFPLRDVPLPCELEKRLVHERCRAEGVSFILTREQFMGDGSQRLIQRDRKLVGSR
jgi:hypothetical protein